MRASFLHDKEDGKLLLWLRAESFTDSDSLLKFIEQSDKISLSYQKGDRITSIYIESVIEKPKPFWKKWFKEKKA